MEVYNGVDPKVIDRAVLYIVLCVVIVVFTMVGYFEDFSGGNLDADDVGSLLIDMVIDFSMLFLIYSVVNRNNGARMGAMILAILNLVLYITYTFSGIAHAIVTVSTIACLVLLLTDPIKGWCIDGDTDDAGSRVIVSREQRLAIVGMFCAFYVIILLSLAIGLLLFNDALLVQITSNDAWYDIAQRIIDSGYATSILEAEDFFRKLLYVAGAILLIGGIMMIFPTYSCFTRKSYSLGLIMMIIATIASVVTIVGLIIGIIAVMVYSSCKCEFVRADDDTDTGPAEMR